MRTFPTKGKKVYFFLLGLLLSSVLHIHAQDRIRVSGTVRDAATGEELVGVFVLEKGTSNGTVTDINGHFGLEAPASSALVFSYIGYVDVEQACTATMHVQMTTQNYQLEEVVAIGYGTARRKDITTAVSSVSSEDFDVRPIVSAGQAIQGKAAGVSVIQPNGAPGGETVIRVRGTTSFNASSDPLYVVDGVPVDNMNFLSPNDILRIDILKDASSAAIYGNRGANGVVIVTTKAGQTQREAKISLNTQITAKTVTNQIQSLNAVQYKELMEEIRPGSTAVMGNEDLTDWYKETYGTGYQQNYQLSVQNGTDKYNYFLSAGYLDEKGILPAAFFHRYNFRASVNNEIRKWLNVGANVSYSDNANNGINTGNGSNRGGVVLAVVNLPTSVAVRNENWYNRSFYGQNITNPVEEMENGKNYKNTENRLVASGNATITFAKGLSLKSTFSLDRRHGIDTGFSTVIHVPGIDSWGSASDTRSQNTVLTFDNILTYNKVFGKHAIEALAGTSWTDSYWNQSYINGSHFLSNDIHTLNAANKISWDNTGSNASAWGIMSYLARAQYNYDGKYYLTANIRADGSSKIHPDNRWGYFPSFSAAWRISDFLKNINWLDDLKLRAGWGQTGNQSGLGDYAYLQRYSITRQPWWETGKGDAVPIITASNVRTSDLKWEVTAQSNVGIDVAALRSRLNIVIDFYHKITSDMLLNVTLPAGANLTSMQRNGGKMTNTGFEFSVNSVNIKNKHIEWTTDLKFSLNRNKLVELDLTKIYYDASTSDAFHGQQIVRNEEGRPLGGFYGFIADGVDPETGELIYRDLNEDGKVTASDRTYIGDPNPDFFYGLTNTVTWKGFSLSIFIQGTYGNDIFNASRIETEGMYDLKNQSTRTLDRWRRPGMETKIPKANFDLRPSSYFIEDGSYLRIKDITLSYNLANDVLKKVGISRLQPYITAQNLLTITKYMGMDPEVNQWGNSNSVQGIDWGTYPQSRAFVFGVNLEF